MEKTPNVRFIRKNGRIIPIFSKEERERRKLQGGALAASGAVTAIGSGFAAGRIAKSATQNAKSASLFTQAASKLSKSSANTVLRDKAIKRGARQLKITKNKLKLAKFGVRGIGFGVGSSLIGLGVTRLNEAHTGTRDGIGAQTAAQVGGIAIAKPVFKSFKTGIGQRALDIIAKRKLKL